MKHIRTQDKEVYDAIQGEQRRQRDGIELIASENYVSSAVREALGSVFTNKYAEGVPGKRYYGGQEYTDAVENTAIERAKKLFRAEHVNVQPLSGAPANLAVYSALLEPGDTVLGLHLAHGGHLTHGHPLTFAARLYRFLRYETTDDGEIDYEALRALALREKPKMIVAGFSSYSRALKYRRFREIADEVGAILMMDMAHIAGLVAGRAVPNPVPHCDVVTTTTHKTLRGPRGGMILCRAEYAQRIDKAVFPGLQGGPHMNNIAALAVALGEALTPEFRGYAKQVVKNARELARRLKKRGMRLCFGGKVENHMMVIDTVSSVGLTGKEAQERLDAVGITVNKNMIPHDPRGPLDPSGIRIGTAAATTRGMSEPQMEEIAGCIDVALRTSDERELRSIRRAVRALCRAHPLP